MEIAAIARFMSVATRFRTRKLTLRTAHGNFENDGDVFDARHHPQPSLAAGAAVDLDRRA
jgi:hypothetical protein